MGVEAIDLERPAVRLWVRWQDDMPQSLPEVNIRCVRKYVARDHPMA